MKESMTYEEYMEQLTAISTQAGEKFREYYSRIQNPLSEPGRKAAVWYAFIIGRDNGGAAAELANRLYDSMIIAEGLYMGRPNGWKEPE